MKDILRNVDHSGRLLKWCIKLSEFNIKYEPMRAIKPQAMTDVISKLPQESVEREEGEVGEPIWTL